MKVKVSNKRGGSTIVPQRFDWFFPPSPSDCAALGSDHRAASSGGPPDARRLRPAAGGQQRQHSLAHSLQERLRDLLQCAHSGLHQLSAHRHAQHAQLQR